MIKKNQLYFGNNFAMKNQISMKFKLKLIIFREYLFSQKKIVKICAFKCAHET